MPDNKLTDNEITLKKLLEVMLSEGDLQRTSTISHTIDLINRQQAEIEWLKKGNSNFLTRVEAEKALERSRDNA